MGLFDNNAGQIILTKNIKYHEQYGKLPSLFTGVYVFGDCTTKSPQSLYCMGIQYGIMQGIAVSYILLNNLMLCFWRKGIKA